MSKSLIGALALIMLYSTQAVAHDHEAPIRALYDSHIKAWLAAPEIAAAINEQNQKHAEYSQTQVDELDHQWRDETKTSDRPLIDEVLSNALSSYLKNVKEQGQGLYTEIFVMDAKGLNVGQSDVTTDYWQGDEAKWKETFGIGSGAVHIGNIEEDESSQMFQSQFSVTVVDPDNGSPIGAVTVGINVEELLQ